MSLNKTIKWIKCDKCKSTFPSNYCKGSCPVCGKPIQKK